MFTVVDLAMRHGMQMDGAEQSTASKVLLVPTKAGVLQWTEDSFVTGGQEQSWLRWFQNRTIGNNGGKQESPLTPTLLSQVTMKKDLSDFQQDNSNKTGLFSTTTIIVTTFA